MSIKCAHCKGRHETVAQVRLCAHRAGVAQPSTTTAAPTRAVATAENNVVTLPKVAARQSLQELLAVPVGKYALAVDGTNNVLFYQVDRPTKGKWAGYTFVKQLFGSPGSFRKLDIRDRQRKENILRLIAADPAGATALFGHELGICGVCSSPLTNEESRARGIGPVCASKRGW